MLLAAVASATAGCGGAPCTTTGDCEQGSYCARDESATEGHCQRDCDDFWSCPEGSVCTAQGQCRLAPRPPLLRLDEPPGTVVGEPGDSVEVRGELTFLGHQATLALHREDRLHCDPVAPVVVTVYGDPAQQRTLPFVFPALTLPDGGGRLRVAASVSGFEVEELRELRAGRRCDGCPDIQLDAPVSGALENRRLFTLLGGEVDRETPGATVWQVLGPAGELLQLPLGVDPAGRFSDVLVPLFVGRNQLVVEARNDVGSSRCVRLLTTATSPADRLQVSLGWTSAAADLDLHLIPPGGSYGLDDCSSAVPDDSRFDSCSAFGDARALGPETLAVPASGPSGTYGIVVLGFSAPPGLSTSAHVRVAAQGRTLLALGPRDLQPARGELWLVGTVTLHATGATPTAVAHDVLLDRAPVRAPEDWPPY